MQQSFNGVMGGQQQSMFFKISGYVSRVYYDEQRTPFYMACPECKKKVLEEANGFRCENCTKFYQNANPTYNFSARVSDYSGSIVASFLGEVGE